MGGCHGIHFLGLPIYLDPFFVPQQLKKLGLLPGLSFGVVLMIHTFDTEGSVLKLSAAVGSFTWADCF